jgi:hypothetical protein
MRRIIINIDESISDEKAIEMVRTVVRLGKISNEVDDPQYCYFTTFKEPIALSCSKTKSGTMSFKAVNYRKGE